MPANIAMEIARAPDGDIQQALAEAYENKLLPGNQILAIRRIILQRNQRRKNPQRPRRTAHRKGYRGVADQELRERSSTADAAGQEGRSSADPVELCRHALRRLFEDDEFLTLLRTEAMHTLPRPLAEQLPNCWKPECPIPSKWRLRARLSACHCQTFCRCGAC